MKNKKKRILITALLILLFLVCPFFVYYFTGVWEIITGQQATQTAKGVIISLLWLVFGCFSLVFCIWIWDEDNFKG